VTLEHIDPMCSLFLSSLHIGMHALILLPKLYTLGFEFSCFVSYAEPCSLESRISLSIICDIEFGLCLCESIVVFHPLRCEVTV
jgi:hypothetical protein